MKTGAIKTGTLVNGYKAEYVTVGNRGLNYGDGLFETLAFRNKQLEFWQAHYERLLQDANKLGIMCPDAECLLKDIHQLLLETQLESAVVKIVLTREADVRGYASRSNRVTRIVSVAEHSFVAEKKTNDVKICRHRVSQNIMLAGIKHLNRLDNVLAANELNNELEGLMLNAEDEVIEGTRSNVFAESEGVLYTPELKYSGVRGIIRQQVMSISDQLNIKIEETCIKADRLLTMQGIFICNSVMGIVPVDTIDGHSIIKSKNTENIIRLFRERIESEAHVIQ